MTKDSMIMRKIIINATVILMMSIIMFGFVKTVKASFESDVTREFHCTSIRIEENDTLWDIASRYFTDEYEDINTYIDIIMEANNMTTSTIHNGNYLIIPYYD